MSDNYDIFVSKALRVLSKSNRASLLPFCK